MTSLSNDPPDKHHYKAIKTSLKSIIKNYTNIRKINGVVIMCNKIVIHTLQLMKLYIIHLYDNNEKLPIINKQFITSVMKTVCVDSRQGGGKQNENTTILKNK